MDSNTLPTIGSLAANAGFTIPRVVTATKLAAIVPIALFLLRLLFLIFCKFAFLTPSSILSSRLSGILISLYLELFI